MERSRAEMHDAHADGAAIVGRQLHARGDMPNAGGGEEFSHASDAAVWGGALWNARETGVIIPLSCRNPNHP